MKQKSRLLRADHFGTLFAVTRCAELIHAQKAGKPGPIELRLEDSDHPEWDDLFEVHRQSDNSTTRHGWQIKRQQESLPREKLSVQLRSLARSTLDVGHLGLLSWVDVEQVGTLRVLQELCNQIRLPFVDRARLIEELTAKERRWWLFALEELGGEALAFETLRRLQVRSLGDETDLRASAFKDLSRWFVEPDLVLDRIVSFLSAYPTPAVPVTHVLLNELLAGFELSFPGPVGSRVALIRSVYGNGAVIGSLDRPVSTPRDRPPISPDVEKRYLRYFEDLSCVTATLGPTGGVVHWHRLNHYGGESFTNVLRLDCSSNEAFIQLCELQRNAAPVTGFAHLPNYYSDLAFEHYRMWQYAKAYGCARLACCAADYARFPPAFRAHCAAGALRGVRNHVDRDLYRAVLERHVLPALRDLAETSERLSPGIAALLLREFLQPLVESDYGGRKELGTWIEGCVVLAEKSDLLGREPIVYADLLRAMAHLGPFTGMSPHRVTSLLERAGEIVVPNHHSVTGLVHATAFLKAHVGDWRGAFDLMKNRNDELRKLLGSPARKAVELGIGRGMIGAGFVFEAVLAARLREKVHLETAVGWAQPHLVPAAQVFNIELFRAGLHEVNAGHSKRILDERNVLRMPLPQKVVQQFVDSTKRTLTLADFRRSRRRLMH